MLYRISVAERGLTGIANIFRSRLSRLDDLLRAGTVPLTRLHCPQPPPYWWRLPLALPRSSLPLSSPLPKSCLSAWHGWRRNWITARGLLGPSAAGVRCQHRRSPRGRALRQRGTITCSTERCRYLLVMSLSENFQTKTKPIPTECQFGKPNTKPILYGLQKADICTKFLKKLIFTHIKVFYKQKIS